MSECVLGLENTCHGGGDLLEVQVIEIVNINVLTYIVRKKHKTWFSRRHVSQLRPS